MHLTVGGTELTLDNSGLVCVPKSHDLNSKARHTHEMITAFLGRRKRLVWLVGDPEVIRFLPYCPLLRSDRGILEPTGAELHNARSH